MSLSSLVLLDLHQNQLQHFGSVPQSDKLDTLNLAFNFLVSVDNLGNSANSLSVLDLHNNKIKDFPMSILDMTSLKTLKISNNDLSDIHPRLSLLQDLVRIHIEGNPLKSIKASVRMANAEGLKKYLKMRL
jgi:Leucine-rich repeat (LRR) protein